MFVEDNGAGRIVPMTSVAYAALGDGASITVPGSIMPKYCGTPVAVWPDGYITSIVSRDIGMSGVLVPLAAVDPTGVRTLM